MTTTIEQPPTTGSGHPVCRFTDALEAGLDRLGDAAAWSMTAEEQRATLTKLAAAQARLTELWLRVLAAGDITNVGAVNASPTTGAWLANATGQTRAGAHADVQLAAALDGEFAATRGALAAGRILVEQARVIVHAVQALPTEEVSFEDRRRAEAHLLGLAAGHDAVELKRLGKHLFEVTAPEHADRLLGEQLAKQEAAARRKTFLELHDNPDGTTSGRFKIPHLHAEMLRKALHALTSPKRVGAEGRVSADGSKLTRPELLGKGLAEFLERYPFHRLGKAAGMNATVVVTMSLEQLLTGLGAASLDTGGQVSAGKARRLACQAGIIPVVLGGDSRPLDVGRKRRLHTEAQRLAITLRDKTCRAPKAVTAFQDSASSTTSPHGHAAARPASTTASCSARGTITAPTTPTTKRARPRTAATDTTDDSGPAKSLESAEDFPARPPGWAVNAVSSRSRPSAGRLRHTGATMTAQPDRVPAPRRTAGSVLVGMFGHTVLEVGAAVAAVVAVVLVGHGLLDKPTSVGGTITGVVRRVDTARPPCVYTRCSPPIYYVETVETGRGSVTVTVYRPPRVGTHVTVYQLGNGTLVGYRRSSAEAIFADLVWAGMAGACAGLLCWLVRLARSFFD